MNNLDFHNLLFPTEFECFCRDLLEIREPGTKFTTYKRGCDGGIDIKSTNTAAKIIGQCKLYNPQNYKELLASLKKEVTKCKRQKPDRYIICTNIELSPSGAEEIKALFGGFIVNEEDIIDGIKLNKYLWQAEYEHLFKTYSKLLVPNLSAVELALEKVVNKKYYNKTKAFFDDINVKHKLFHSTAQLPHLIQALEENKVIILSGNPGVGKTTTAMMMANYFFNRKKCDVIYLEERDYPETLALADENRLVIVDDFWGQNFSPSIHNHSTFQRELQSIIKYFTGSSNNNYLILVSREYVIKDVLTNAEHETERLLNYNKHIININKFNFEDKLRIFVNHLLFYDCELDYISTIKYQDGFEHLLNHKNYSPRHLDFFIKTYLKTERASSYKFYKEFGEYLDNPSAYWKEEVGKLNPTSKLMLLILLTSGDPLSLEDLKQSFDAMQADARQALGINITPLDFRKELIKLEEFYISIEHDWYYSTTFIKFQSPGIKDYLLEYLRTDGYLWIHPIISNAIFFNQLTFIFSITDKDIRAFEMDIYLTGKKIILDDTLIKVLKHKLLSEFDTLHFSNYEGTEISDQLTRFNSKNDIKYLKLIELNSLFNVNFLENKDVKEFIVKQVLCDFNDYKPQGKIVSHKSMMYFHSVIKLIYPALGITADRILEVYYSSITFAAEYDYFYNFKEIFPVEFQKLYDSNIQKIKRHIKDLIFEDIAYYLEEDDDDGIGMELDILRSYIIKELSKQYKIRITSKFVKQLKSTFKIDFSDLLKSDSRKTNKHKYKPAKSIDRYKPKPYTSIIDEYLPAEENYDPISFLGDYKYNEYIAEIEKIDSALSEFKENKALFENICHFISSNKINVSDIETYHLFDLYFEQYSNKLGMSSKLLADLYYQIGNELEQYNQYSITKSRLNQLIKGSSLSKLIIEDMSPIIVTYKTWYRFSDNILKTYFLAKSIGSITNPVQYKEEITDALHMDDPDDIQILKFIQSIDKKRLWNLYILPELNRFTTSIDYSSEQAMVLSFVRFFDPQFEVSWKKKEKTFASWGSSCSESHYEKILLFCNIEFNISDLELYFEEEYQGEETVKTSGINTNYVENLKMSVLKTVQSEETTGFINDEIEIIYNINLFDFLQPEDNYKAAFECGMIPYISSIIEKTKEVLKSQVD